MSYRIVHDTEATAEFREAVAWYEAQVEGLGIRFVHAVDQVMAAIAAQPLRALTALRTVCNRTSAFKRT